MRQAGLDPKLMIDVLNVSSGRRSATLDKWPKAVLPRSFDFGFANALSFKDVRLCLEEAEAMGVPMVVGSTVRQMLSITANMYGPTPTSPIWHGFWKRGRASAPPNPNRSKEYPNVQRAVRQGP